MQDTSSPSSTLLQSAEHADLIKKLHSQADQLSGINFLISDCEFLVETHPTLFVELTQQVIPSGSDREDLLGDEKLQQIGPRLAVLLRGRAMAQMGARCIPEALSDVKFSRQIGEKLADDEIVQAAQLAEGSIYIYSDKVAQGAEILEKIKPSFPENTKLEFSLRVHLASAYSMLGQQLNTLNECEVLLERLADQNAPRSLLKVYRLLARTYGNLEKKDSARQYYELALEVARTLDSNTLLTSILGLASFLVAEQDFGARTLELLEDAEKIIDPATDLGNTTILWKCFAFLYIANGDYSRADVYAQKIAGLGDDKLMSHEIGDVQRIQALLEFHLRSKEAGILLAQKSLDTAREKQILVSEAAALADLAQMYTATQQYKLALETTLTANKVEAKIMGERQQRLHADIEASIRVKTSRLQAAMSQAESKLHQLQAEKVAAEMKLIRNEVVAKALHISQKNELLQSINQSVQEARASDAEHSAAILQDLNRNLEIHLADNYSWQTFEEGFKLLYPSFMENIAKLYPKLTVNDIRICALMHLKLTAKDICRIAAIAPRSIESYRYRIRKKIGLDSSTDLTAYLSSIDSGHVASPEITHN